MACSESSHWLVGSQIRSPSCPKLPIVFVGVGDWSKPISQTPLLTGFRLGLASGTQGRKKPGYSFSLFLVAFLAALTLAPLRRFFPPGPSTSWVPWSLGSRHSACSLCLSSPGVASEKLLAVELPASLSLVYPFSFSNIIVTGFPSLITSVEHAALALGV